MVIRKYVIMLYGFFEKIHFLYRRKWIDEDTWRQWAAFLEVVAAHPVFRDVHQSSREMFDKPFQDYVSGILSRKKMKQTISLRESRLTLCVGSSFCSILHEFNNRTWLGKQWLFCA